MKSIDRVTLTRPSFAILAFVGVLALLAGASETQGSILAPRSVDFDASDINASAVESMPDGGMSSPSHVPSRDQDEERAPDPKNLTMPVLPPSGGPAGGSSSSPTGGAGSYFAACLVREAIAIEDEQLVGQLAQDRHLFLPDAPGTDLLRPPRCA